MDKGISIIIRLAHFLRATHILEVMERAIRTKQKPRGSFEKTFKFSNMKSNTEKGLLLKKRNTVRSLQVFEE